MSTPHVSVITIFRDPGPYLVTAMDSVMAQSYRDFEYLLVDDGSSDSSSEVARERAARHPDRVRYLDHPGHAHRGMSATRNAGLHAARGDLVAFLDADDAWLPDTLERQVAILDRHPDAAMTIGATLYWHSWDDAALESDRVFRMGPTGQVPPPALAPRLVNGEVRPPSMNAWVARRDAVSAVGGFEEDFPSLFEDQAFLFKFLLAHPVVIHEQVMDRYRQHDRSACAVGLASGEYALRDANPARLAFRTFALNHVSTPPWRGTEVWRAIRRAQLVDRYPRAGRVWRRLRPQGVRRAVGQQVSRGRAREPVDLGGLRRTTPISTDYGYDRGRPVDRHYIEWFYAVHGDDIRGTVLEVGESIYTRRFGRGVDHVDVLHVDRTNPQATVVADLAAAPQIPDGSYDCVLIPQTLQYIRDVDAAMSELHRILKPGGVVLATVPGISRLTDEEGWRHHWSFTQHSAQHLFAAHFPDVLVEPRGNVLTATAFLYGLADHELTADEMARVDRRYPVTICVRARRGATIA